MFQPFHVNISMASDAIESSLAEHRRKVFIKLRQHVARISGMDAAGNTLAYATAFRPLKNVQYLVSAGHIAYDPRDMTKTRARGPTSYVAEYPDGTIVPLTLESYSDNPDLSVLIPCPGRTLPAIEVDLQADICIIGDTVYLLACNTRPDHSFCHSFCKRQLLLVELSF